MGDPRAVSARRGSWEMREKAPSRSLAKSTYKVFRATGVPKESRSNLRIGALLYQPNGALADEEDSEAVEDGVNDAEVALKHRALLACSAHRAQAGGPIARY